MSSSRLTLLALLVAASSAQLAHTVRAQGCVPSAEVCDGVDNDCDEAIDELPLADAPSPSAEGCWSSPGNCCSFGALNWCPPPGATCSSSGALPSPCMQGALRCAGGGWSCVGSTAPTAESCNGVDDDCDGSTDEGTNPGGACTVGVGACEATGALLCGGAQGVVCDVEPLAPTLEVCGNSVDDDCNGLVDDGFTLGASCTVGVGACTSTGQFVCDAGAEVCDAVPGSPTLESCGNAVDDDCNGMVDETCPVDAGVVDDAGPTDDGGVLDDAGGPVDTGVVGDSGVDVGVDAGASPTDSSAGCSCRVGSTASPTAPLASAVALLGVWLTRHRRRFAGR